MSRPLMQSRIQDLEDLFATSRAKLDVLRQLEHELQFRQVPRALTLLEQVQQAQASASTATGGATAAGFPVRPMAATGQQLSLLETPTLVCAPQVSGHTAVSGAQVPVPTTMSAFPQPTAQTPAPAMSLDAAHKLLKVAPGAPWDAVELARRKVVQPSSPLTKGVTTDQRAKFLATARLVNEAYAVLASARITKQFADLGGL
jgi:hypothetical protein